MEAQELKDKIGQVVGLLEEIVNELKGGTTIGVITQQVHANMVQAQRSIGIVLANMEEAQKASESQEEKDKLPENAPSPASGADVSES